jgi:cytoskeletal protein CcmA (bactofilin family)
MAALGAQSIAQSYEQLLHVDRDGGGNLTNHVAIKDGDNGTTFGFTIATDALMMSSTNRLEFGDTGTYIHQSADGVLDLVSDTEIEINATTIDINGAVAMDGAMTGGTNITISGELDAATLDISGNADINGTLEADAYTVDGTALDEFIADTVGAMVGSNTETGVAVTYEDGDNTLDFVLGAAQTTITSLLAADIKIGEDDETKIDFETANEIHFYANNTEQVYVADNIFGPEADSDVDLGTTGVRWKDAFVDSITVTGEVDAATLDISGAIDVAGTANLDVVDIDGAVNMAADLTMGANIIMADDTSIGIADDAERIEFDGAGDISVLGANFAIGTTTPNLAEYGSGQTVLSVVNESSAGNYGAIEIAGNRTNDGAVADLNFIHTDGSDAVQARALIRGYRDGANDAIGLQVFTEKTGESTAERFRITSAGVLDLLKGQIKFPATQNASSDANTLDDYEEGTITPTLLGSSSNPTQTYDSRGGFYQKIGNRVFYTIRIEMNGSGISAGSGDLIIGGLPFTIANDVNNYGAVTGIPSGFGTGQHGAPTNGYHSINETLLRLQVYDNDGGNIAGASNADAADVTNGTTITVSGNYKV